jgi:integrase
MGYEKPRKGTGKNAGKTTWTAVYIDPHGHERSAGTYRTRKDAREAWKDAEGVVRGGKWLDPKDTRQTFRQYVLETWWPNQARLEVRTQQGYWGRVRTHMLPKLGDVQMRHIRHSVLQGWVTELQAAGQSAANIRAIFAVLNIILRDAVRDGVKDHNPKAEVKLPKVPKRREVKKQWKILQGAEADRFEAAVMTLPEKWKVMMLLELELGARFGELRALRPHHLNPLRSWVRIEESVAETTKERLDEAQERYWPKNRIRINDRFYVKLPKDDEGRTVSIDPTVMRMVLDYVQANGIGRDDLIFTTDTGAPVDSSNFHRDVWKPLLRKAQLDGHLRIHDLRHSVASWNLAGGADIAKVSEALGHAHMTTTELYLHTDEEAADDVRAARQRARGGRGS